MNVFQPAQQKEIKSNSPHGNHLKVLRLKSQFRIVQRTVYGLRGVTRKYPKKTERKVLIWKPVFNGCTIIL